MDDGHDMWSSTGVNGDDSAGDGNAADDTAGNILPHYQCHLILMYLFFSREPDLEQPIVENNLTCLLDLLSMKMMPGSPSLHQNTLFQMMNPH